MKRGIVVINHVKGDIFKSDADIIIHQVNCQGVDDNRFLDRYDAAHVAYENGQTDNFCYPLYSEDVW